MLLLAPYGRSATINILERQRAQTQEGQEELSEGILVPKKSETEKGKRRELYRGMKLK